jgi:hypothetical protein
LPANNQPAGNVEKMASAKNGRRSLSLPIILARITHRKKTKTSIPMNIEEKPVQLVASSSSQTGKCSSGSSICHDLKMDPKASSSMPVGMLNRVGRKFVMILDNNTNL